MNDNQNKESVDNVEKATTESRRNFLKKAGAFALYTPPAITMLMHPSHAKVTQSAGGKHHQYGNKHGKKHGSNKHGNNDPKHNGKFW